MAINIVTVDTVAVFVLLLICSSITDQQENMMIPQVSDAQNAINMSSSSDGTMATSTIDTFGVPPDVLTNSSSSTMSTSRTSGFPVDQAGVTYPESTTADRRTFNMLGGGGGGGYGGGGYGGGGGGGLVSILTPLAGAAAAALTAGGGASLLSLPNANIQPTIQKTFVVNMSPHNPPLVVQGNAHQPGASAGQTVNNQYGRRGTGGGGGYYSSYPSGSGGPNSYASKSGGGGNYGRHKADGRGGHGDGAGGYVKYPNSPSFPQVAGKLGLANVLNLARQSGFLDNLLIGGPFTFFAPSDEAFTRLPKIFLDRAADNPELMKTLLLYHVVPDTVTTRHFTNDLLLPTLNTKKLRINIYQLGYKKAK